MESHVEYVLVFDCLVIELSTSVIIRFSEYKEHASMYALDFIQLYGKNVVIACRVVSIGNEYERTRR